jgi:hypothetical protein
MAWLVNKGRGLSAPLQLVLSGRAIAYQYEWLIILSSAMYCPWAAHS